MGLSAADEGRRIDAVAPLYDAIDRRCAGRLGERFELGELCFQRGCELGRFDGDDERAIAHGVPLAIGDRRSISQRMPSL